MIVSASYRTDIPTFYGQWFMNRLRAGHCRVRNPYDSGQINTVSLKREDVDGFVFWTKNLAPFRQHLPEIHAAGYPFVIQYAINGYPRALESSVIDATRAAEHMHDAAQRYGPHVCVWRYDTIVVSSLTPQDFHLRNFERLAKSLAGATDEVVISFAQFYRKTLQNMRAAGEREGFTWEDPSTEAKRALVSQLLPIATAHGMRLCICSQRDYLIPGVHDARCIDAARFERITGRPLKARLKGNRPECGCYESRDIGEYDTCPHGCVYCYAVRNPTLARRRFAAHDPDAEALLP